MATITERNGRYRALVRRRGQTRCATFSTRAQAKAWARRTETELEELRATGLIVPKDKTLADLIDAYKGELYEIKRWGRSKEADLTRLRRDLGTLPATEVRKAPVLAYFRRRQAEGTGAVSLHSAITYLIGVLDYAHKVLQYDVAVEDIRNLRAQMAKLGTIGRSQERDRRVTEAELQRLCDYFSGQNTDIPMADILQFCVATAMRISEVCRLTWSDLDAEKRTIIVRDRKHPSQKFGNDQVVPLLDATGHDALAIVQRQPRGQSRIFPYSHRTVGTYVTRAVAALGIDDLHLHDLRHEGISRLFEAGYRIEQVALVSGHRDWAMLRRYTHVRAADLVRGPQVRP